MAAIVWGDHARVLFGGAFDPPHLAHVEAVRVLIEEMNAPQVILLPSAGSREKPWMTPSLKRLEMIRIAFKDLSRRYPERFQIDAFEIENYEPRGLPSVTADTLGTFRKEHENLWFVIGMDQFEHLHEWHHPKELLTLARWGIFPRNERSEKEFQLQYERLNSLFRDVEPSQRIRWIPHFLGEEKSTQIRVDLSLGRTPTGLNEPVLKYIAENRLYQ